MIHYYSYYSVGGYKDMYLGNSGMNDCRSTYYLPLLPVLETEVAENDDKSKREEIARLRVLPKINLVTAQERLGLPAVATSITTRGCYSMIYTHLEGDKYAIIIHDVVNDSKDSSGRAIPFLVLFMSDSTSDLQTMNKLATYISANMKTARVKLGSFFRYDVDANGLRFELQQMNEWVNSVVENEHALLKHVNSKILTLEAKPNMVTLLITRNGISVKKALEELNIGKEADIAIEENRYLPNDDSKTAELNSRIWNDNRKKQTYKYIVIGGSILVCAITTYCLMRCIVPKG